MDERDHPDVEPKASHPLDHTAGADRTVVELLAVIGERCRVLEYRDDARIARVVKPATARADAAAATGSLAVLGDFGRSSAYFVDNRRYTLWLADTPRGTTVRHESGVAEIADGRFGLGGRKVVPRLYPAAGCPIVTAVSLLPDSRETDNAWTVWVATHRARRYTAVPDTRIAGR